MQLREYSSSHFCRVAISKNTIMILCKFGQLLKSILKIDQPVGTTKFHYGIKSKDII